MIKNLWPLSENHKNKIVVLLATFFGSGKFPKAPGTMGTLATLPLWFLMSKLSIVAYMFLVIFFLISGVIVCQAYENLNGTHDSKEIVIDEVVGFLIAMTWLPVTWQSAGLGFLLFRFFDIVKPPPIRQLDQKVKGGVGVMIDDVAAGIVCNLILQIIYTKTFWLGAQIQTFS